jgi:Flp pilus assembly protein TadD
MNSRHKHLEPALGYLALGMHQDAWDELESLQPELRADDRVLEIRISIYHALKKWESARILAESLASRSPEEVGWWVLWAYSLRREKSIPDARAVLLEASKVHPDEALIPYNLACYCCVEGDLIGAKGFLNLAFTMDRDLRQVALDDADLEPIFGSEK